MRPNWCILLLCFGAFWLHFFVYCILLAFLLMWFSLYFFFDMNWLYFVWCSFGCVLFSVFIAFCLFLFQCDFGCILLGVFCLYFVLFYCILLVFWLMSFGLYFLWYVLVLICLICLGVLCLVCRLCLHSVVVTMFLSVNGSVCLYFLCLISSCIFILFRDQRSIGIYFYLEWWSYFNVWQLICMSSTHQFLQE